MNRASQQAAPSDLPSFASGNESFELNRDDALQLIGASLGFGISWNSLELPMLHAGPTTIKKS